MKLDATMRQLTSEKKALATEASKLREAHSKVEPEPPNPDTPVSPYPSHYRKLFILTLTLILPLTLTLTPVPNSPGSEFPHGLPGRERSPTIDP